MAQPQKFLTVVMLCFVGVLFLIGIYAKLWEWRQPKQHIPQAKVVSLKPYSSDNDLHWTARGYRLHIEGERRVIDFPLKHWDDTVNEGDIVTISVRKSFPFFGDELDGLSIDDHK